MPLPAHKPPHRANNDPSTITNSTTSSSTMSRDQNQVQGSARPKHWTKYYRTELAASSSTIMSTFLVFPLESIKIRIQSNPQDALTVRKSANAVWNKEGYKGFWRGVGAPLVSITAVRTLSFSVYQHAKYKVSSTIGKLTGQEEPLVVINRPGSVPTYGTIACFGLAGAAAGCVSTLLACPFEFTKNAMVLAKNLAESKSSSNNPIARSYMNKGTALTARQIVRNCGLMGLYTGFQLQMTRETFGTAIYFMTYESVKQLMVKHEGVKSPTSPMAVAVAGGFCGMVSLISTYPLDRAKTAYQFGCLELGKNKLPKQPAIEYFKKASYQGLGVGVTRSALTNAILFSSFEWAKKYINNLPDPID